MEEFVLTFALPDMSPQKEGSSRGPVVAAEARVSRCKQLNTSDCHENQTTILHPNYTFCHKISRHRGGGRMFARGRTGSHPILTGHLVSDTRCFALFMLSLFFALV